MSEQLDMSYGRKQIVLEQIPVSDMLGGQYVDLYDYPDMPLELRRNGPSLPDRVVEKVGV